jgi:hypothetical protein
LIRVEIMDDLPGEITRLAARMEALERRIEALEHPGEASTAVAIPHSIPIQTAQADETIPFALAGGAFSVLGTAMLGIAGAYLLRAVAESSSLPKIGIAAIAIAYAIFWLVWAARAPSGAWFAGTTYASTSALILAPMLWELTLRFNVLPAAATAGVLGAFVCVASALAWKRNLAPIVWVANATAAPLALALAIATHQLLPFAAALLVMVLLSEFAAIRNRGLGVGLLTAAAADVAVWALVFIYSGPPGARVEYPILGTAALLAPGIGLFLIYGLSVAAKTAMMRQKITTFEIIQTMVAFLLAAFSLLTIGARGGSTVFGIACLLLSAMDYAAAFAVFDQDSERRNFRIFTAWSAALFLAGCIFCLPPDWMGASLGAAAIAVAFLGARLKRPALELHGVIYLLAAAVVSGLLQYAFSALAGTLPGAPPVGVSLVSACVVLCYAAANSGKEKQWTTQFLTIVSATLAVCAATALAVECLMSVLAWSVSIGPHHMAFIRTLSTCVAALALAFGGAHWRRMELTRIGYAALALVAVKLVFEDLRQGHLGFIAASIFLFAVTLIALPRIARLGEKAQSLQ